MQRELLTPEQIRARLVSTRDLLREIANETHQTQIEIMPEEMSAEAWYQYRELSLEISDAAAHAATLADTLQYQPRPNQVAQPADPA